MWVSVVLPVLNESRDIRRLLQELLEQDYPATDFEVLVVDGGSTDGTLDIVRSLAQNHPNLMLLDNPSRRSSAGRNVGARAASGEFIVYVDGHCSVPRSDYLRRLVDIFRSTGADCLCRPQPLEFLNESGWGSAIAVARTSFLGHNAGSDIYGGQAGFTNPRSAGAAYRRRVWETLGGYDERFDACEDVEFNHRVAVAGLSSYFHPELAVHYRPRSRPVGLFRQMFRYGRGRARLMAKHPVTAPVPLLFLSGVAVLAVVALPLAGVSLVLSGLGVLAGLWLLLVVVESVRLGTSWSGRGRTAVAFAAIYSGLTLGFWRGIAEWRRFRKPARPSRGMSGDEHRARV